MQPREEGPCLKQRVRRYFFDTMTGKCSEFEFGGIHLANSNVFLLCVYF